jgi:hypothetical protein
MKLLLTTLLATLGLVSCTTPDVQPTPSQVSQEEVPDAWPRSPTLESSWGKPSGPSMILSGRQALTYVKPGERGCAVRIVYEGKVQPAEIPDFSGKRASDGTLTIMGQTVDFYGSGNEDPEISTQAVPLTSPGGVTAWYTFQFSCKEHLKGKNIPGFGW